MPSGVEVTSQGVLAEIAGLLVRVTGEDERWAARITPASRLEGDLLLESVELAELAALLTDAYGDRVDLAKLYAGLDIDQIIGLTAGDLARYVTRCLAASPAGSRS